MNRGFKLYYREGLSLAFKTFRKKGNYIRYYLFWIVSLIGKFIPIASPAFFLATSRLARNVKVNQDIVISSAFEATDEKNSTRTMLWSLVIAGLILVGGILLIGVFGLLLYLLGSGICDEANMEEMIPVFLIPAAILLVVFVVSFFIYFSPISYIVDTNPEIGVSDVLYNSVDSMKRNGKKTLLLINFIGLFNVLLIIGLAVVAFLILI